MNPPFSASPGVDRIRHDADLRHIRSAFSMLTPGRAAGGDLVGPLRPRRRRLGGRIRIARPARARRVHRTAIDGRAYARRGTTFDTRLTVLDRGGDATRARIYAGHTRVERTPPTCSRSSPRTDAAAPAHPASCRAPTSSAVHPAPQARTGQSVPATAAHGPAEATSHTTGAPVAALAYEADPGSIRRRAIHDRRAPTQASGPYEPWRPCAIHVPGAVAHPDAAGAVGRHGGGAAPGAHLPSHPARAA